MSKNMTELKVFLVYMNALHDRKPLEKLLEVYNDSKKVVEQDKSEYDDCMQYVVSYEKNAQVILELINRPVNFQSNWAEIREIYKKIFKPGQPHFNKAMNLIDELSELTQDYKTAKSSVENYELLLETYKMGNQISADFTGVFCSLLIDIGNKHIETLEALEVSLAGLELKGE